jgi:hypothetical protein
LGNDSSVLVHLAIAAELIGGEPDCGSTATTLDMAPYSLLDRLVIRSTEVGSATRK